MNNASRRVVLRRPLILLAVLNLGTGILGASEWSRYRGPNGSGISDAVGLPIAFGPAKHVVWKTKLPPGHSSPVLTEKRIFLTAFEDEVLLTFCLDRETGEIVWRRAAPRDRTEKLDRRNSPASPTPVTDGENVSVFFGTGYFSVFGVISAELFPTRIRATAQGLTYNMGRVASAAAPFVVGTLAETYGLGMAFNVTAAAFLFSAALAAFIPETRGKELE